MSHETRASAWSALFGLQDLAAGLRDVIGHLTLKQIRSSYDSQETPRRFQEYSLELNIALDAIRFLSKIDSKQTSSLQEDLVSAVAHFLNGLAVDCMGEQSDFQDEAHRLILGYSFCAAVAALRACAWDCSQELRALIVKQAGKLLKHASVKDESLWLIQTLASLLVSHYTSATPLEQGIDQSQTRWKMLWENKSSRGEIIQEMVKRATDDNVAKADRILPMLDLCQLYWDTDNLLIQACTRSPRSRWLERVFYVPSDADAVWLAMEVRRSVQEQFAIRSTRVSLGPDKLQTQLYVMFSPGLRLSCVSDTCSCPFDEKLELIISDARTRQTDLLYSATTAAFYRSPILNISHHLFDQIYTSFGQRLRRWPQVISVDPFEHSVAPKDGPSDSESMLALQEPVIGQRPRLMSFQSAGDPIEERHEPGIKQRSHSQPSIHRRYTRATPPAHRVPEWTPKQAELETQIEEPMLVVLSDRTSLSELDGSCPASPPRFPTGSPSEVPPELGRTESTTTTSTSTGTRSHYSGVSSSRPPALTSYKELGSELPEPVTIRPFMAISPHDFERSYPEVVIDPITSIHEDNMSLFSQTSNPRTTRSASRVTNQRKFNLFKASKCGFAIPAVRFFASAKHMIAWTKYGGVCFDIRDPDDAKAQPINSSDIILGAGGTYKYCVIARYQEAYSLCVYRLGEHDAFLKINLGSCPRAIDLSRNDQYLAIKYAQGVRVFDLEKSTKIDHKLPKMEGANSPPGGHLVAFSHDSDSFMASTRMGPEKVLTYFSNCMDRSKNMVVHSFAPCGNIDDHGLTSLMLAGSAVRGIPTGFLSTFTERGGPVVLAMGTQPQAIPVRGPRDLVGTRIHGAGMHVDNNTKKSTMVMVNHNNDIFWVSDLFGRGQEISKLKSLKRPKSMKPEVLVGMANAEEASIFWIDQKTRLGLLIKVGRSGGISPKPYEIQLDIEPMCAG